MSDLDKLMNKMNDNKKSPVEKPVEEKKEIVDDDEDTDIEDIETEKVSEDKVDEKKVMSEEKAGDDSEEIPSKQEDHSIEQEIGILQNNGIFRRELILILKELVDVYKVNTQALIEIKKKLLGEEEEKKIDP